MPYKILYTKVVNITLQLFNRKLRKYFFSRKESHGVVSSFTGSESHAQNLKNSVKRVYAGFAGQ